MKKNNPYPTGFDKNIAIKKPEYLTEEHLVYLDGLQESGTANMLGAVSFILRQFPDLTEQQARQVLIYWMEHRRKPRAQKYCKEHSGPVRQKQIEDTIFDPGMAVNSIVALRRMLDLLDEHKTNCIDDDYVKEDPRMKRLFWFVNAQMYGMTTKIDMSDLWRKLRVEFDEGRKEKG